MCTQNLFSVKLTYEPLNFCKMEKLQFQFIEELSVFTATKSFYKLI